MGEHELVVLRAERGHHYGEYVGDCCRPDDFGAEAVEEGSSEAVSAEEEEDLEGADPGDCRGGLVMELVGLVVLLVYTE